MERSAGGRLTNVEADVNYNLQSVQSVQSASSTMPSDEARPSVHRRYGVPALSVKDQVPAANERATQSNNKRAQSVRRTIPYLYTSFLSEDYRQP